MGGRWRGRSTVLRQGSRRATPVHYLSPWRQLPAASSIELIRCAGLCFPAGGRGDGSSHLLLLYFYLFIDSYKNTFAPSYKNAILDCIVKGLDPRFDITKIAKP